MSKYNNIGPVTILSFGFFILFTAFSTLANFTPKVLDDEGFGNLGFINLAVVYLFYAISCFFASAIVNKIGRINMSLTLGGFCYAFFIASFLLPSHFQNADKKNLPWYLNKTFIKVVMITASAINGVGASILWVS
jgi:MFS family permease